MNWKVPCFVGERGHAEACAGPGKAASFRFLVAAALAAAWLFGCGYFVKPRGEVLPVHEQAPQFTLQDQNGQAVSLQGMLSRGPVLLVFYRGHW